MEQNHGVTVDRRSPDMSETSGLLDATGLHREIIEHGSQARFASETGRSNSYWRYVLGLSLLFIVAAIWTGASVLVKAIYDTGYAQPFLLTYVSNSLFIILLPIFAIVRWAEDLLVRVVSDGRDTTREPNSLASVCLGICRAMPCSTGNQLSVLKAKTSPVRFPVHDMLDGAEQAVCCMTREYRGVGPAASARCGGLCCFGPRERNACSRVTLFRVDWLASMRAAICVSPLWFLAQETYNWSLEGVSVSVSTVLSTTSCVFTLALSVLVLRERLTAMKILGVGLTVLGGLSIASERWGLGLDRPLPIGGRHARKHHHDSVAGVENDDERASSPTMTVLNTEGGSSATEPSSGSSNTAWGILVCLGSAVLYGVYTVAIRVGVPDEDDTGAATKDASKNGPIVNRSSRSRAELGVGLDEVHQETMDSDIDVDMVSASAPVHAPEPIPADRDDSQPASNVHLGNHAANSDVGAFEGPARHPKSQTGFRRWVSDTNMMGQQQGVAESEAQPVHATIPGNVPLPVFFGLLGLVNAILLLPIVVILHLTGVEPLDSRVREAIGLVVIKGLLDNVLADFLWAKAIVLTTPTVATVGLSLTIPMAMASDWVMHGAPTMALAVGAALIIAGFMAINFGGYVCGEGDEIAQTEGVPHPAGTANRTATLGDLPARELKDDGGTDGDGNGDGGV